MSKAREIVEGLRELTEALKAGEPLESRFTVDVPDRPAASGYGAGDVRRVRGGLGRGI